jgi:ribosomal protein L35
MANYKNGMKYNKNNTRHIQTQKPTKNTTYNLDL